MNIIDPNTFFDVDDVPDNSTNGMLNTNIARAATSWSAVFAGRKEVNRKTAKTCRAAMTIARNKNKEPVDCLKEASKINDVEWEDITLTIMKLS